MLRLDVITATNQPEGLIQNPSSNALALAAFYKDKLNEAAASQTELLYFEGIAFEEKKSTNFQNINIIEKSIMDFLYENEFPKKVCIVCDSAEKTELYKVVYNFYYPETEDDRLEDSLWK